MPAEIRGNLVFYHLSTCAFHDMLVEPFLLVDPLRVFGEVVTNFLMSPFSVIGIHLNKFFNDFFVDTPFILAIVKLLIILLVLFYLSHYRIKSIFFTIEPARKLHIWSFLFFFS